MPVPEKRDAVARPLLRDSAYERLADAIVAGTLAPGERLHDAQLCRWLGLSRTPIREALARLEDEGLVETAPQRYTRVTPMDPHLAADVFGVLAAMHALAAELATGCLTLSDFDALRAAQRDYVVALRDGDWPAVVASDDAFHGVFVERCDSLQVRRVLGHLLPSQHRLERLRGDAQPGHRSIAQHEAIVDRARAGDASGTAHLARENWRELGALVERNLQTA